MSSSTSSNTTRASISLKFVIVGGGIAGLATAYALRKAGHSVVVLEKRDVKSMSYKMAGIIRVPPNMTKLLYRWGLGPILNKKGRKCDRLITVNGNTGELLGSLILGEVFFQVLLTDLLLIQHSDLLNILYDMAVREGVEIRQNANVIHADPKCVSVKLDTGEIISGDIIVAADGHSSSLLSNVMGYRDLKSVEKVLWFTFTIETCLLEDDENFKSILDPRNWSMWLGEDTFTQTYIVQEGGHLIGMLSCNYHGPSNEADEEWSNTRDLESYGLDITVFEPRLQKLLRLSKFVASRIYHKRPIPQDLANDHSSIVLVGEAAHPVAIFEGHQGTALVIEDAVTMGSLFSRIRTREQAKQLLTAYEEIRSPRCARIYRLGEALTQVLKVPRGPPQEARDAIFRKTLAFSDLDHMDEMAFLSAWGDQLAIFAYDTNDAVDDWWRQWGFLISRDDNPQSMPGFNALEVWISREGRSVSLL